MNALVWFCCLASGQSTSRSSCRGWQCHGAYVRLARGGALVKVLNCTGCQQRRGVAHSEGKHGRLYACSCGALFSFKVAILGGTSRTCPERPCQGPSGNFGKNSAPLPVLPRDPSVVPVLHRRGGSGWIASRSRRAAARLAASRADWHLRCHARLRCRAHLRCRLLLKRPCRPLMLAD